MKLLAVVLRFIGVVQLVLGLLFILTPDLVAPALGLDPHQPAWVNWLFVMAGARFVGYGLGMFAAAHDPDRGSPWVDTMIFIQAVDWIATLGYLAAGDVALHNVTTAAFLPPLFVAALVTWRTRLTRTTGSQAR